MTQKEIKTKTTKWFWNRKWYLTIFFSFQRKFIPKYFAGGANSLAKRILVLAQKGDWAACESALKALDRSAGEEGAAKPLADIADNVIIEFFYNLKGF